MNIRFPIILLVAIASFLHSCKPILQNTVGKAHYRKHFIQAYTSEKIFKHDIQYEIIENQIVIKARIAHQEYNFLFDTGAESYLSSEIIADLGIKPIMEVVRLDFNNQRTSSNLYIVKSVDIGPLTINNWSILSMDFRSLNANRCVRIDGIIGRNILNLGIFHFAHQEKTLTISSPNKHALAKKNASTIRIKRTWDYNMIVSNAFVDASRTSFLVDTGYDGFIKLAGPHSYTLEKERHQFVGSMSQSKLQIIPFFKIDKLRLGSLSFDSLIATGHSGKTISLNLIGNYLFRTTDVTIDMMRKKIFLGPHKTTVPTLVANLKIGWRADPKEYYVSALTLRGKLSQELHISDTIVSINNLLPSHFSDYCSFKNFRDSIDLNQTKLKLTVLKNGDERVYWIDKNIMYD